MSAAAAIEAHRAAGRLFDAGGVRSFVRAEGAGEPVVCVHGVPSSSFLYRRLLPELAARGLRGVAFDLPGLGIAERPEAFDYTWTGLGAWCAEAVDALELERFHLVLHDIGGPVGLELAAARLERVASVTLLNTLVDVEGFRRPWSMEPFARRGIGKAYLATMTKPAFFALFRLQGGRTTPRDEVYAYVDLLKRIDGGRAFLRIMRGFERTAEKSRLYRETLRAVPARQIVWGRDDPALKLSVHGEQAREAAGLDEIVALPGKHFVPEDQPVAIAERVASLAGSA
jgi:pimeloyl-ACP methyl ester carboxylesterase